MGPWELGLNKLRPLISFIFRGYTRVYPELYPPCGRAASIFESVAKGFISKNYVSLLRITVLNSSLGRLHEPIGVQLSQRGQSGARLTGEVDCYQYASRWTLHRLFRSRPVPATLFISLIGPPSRPPFWRRRALCPIIVAVVTVLWTVLPLLLPPCP